MSATTTRSSELYARAQALLPGGVNSPVRAMRSIGRDPIFIHSGSGSRLIDVDGNEYIDWVGSWGPLVLGHAHPAVVAAVTEAARTAIERICGAGVVTCRFTHVYPDGPAPYYGIYAGGRWGSLDAQWDDIKAAVSDAIAASGGTITHHHAVGRDHRPWYDRQRPDPFAAALRAAKSALDPAGILNPGVLLDP